MSEDKNTARLLGIAQQGLKTAVTELFEAEDKFWVTHCALPKGQLKDFCAAWSSRMGDAKRFVREALVALENPELSADIAPTQWAYERVCDALESHKKRIASKDEEIADLNRVIILLKAAARHGAKP